MTLDVRGVKEKWTVDRRKERTQISLAPRRFPLLLLDWPKLPILG